MNFIFLFMNSLDSSSFSFQKIFYKYFFQILFDLLLVPQKGKHVTI